MGADDIPLTFDGQQLRDWRKRYRLTQRSLGAAIGYSRQSVTAWEAGRRTIPLDAYTAILHTLAAVRAEQADLYEAMRRACAVL